MRPLLVVFALSCAVATPGAAQRPNDQRQLAAFIGAADGVLGFVIDDDRWVPVIASEFAARFEGDFILTFTLAYSALTDRNACCGPTPTLSYTYHSIAPTAGGAYDFVWRPFRLRAGASLGPAMLLQTRRGNPPPGVGPNDADWQTHWLFLSGQLTLHYTGYRGLGFLAGLRVYQLYSLGGGRVQAVPNVGASLSW